MKLARVMPVAVVMAAGVFLLLGLSGCGNPALTSGKVYVQQSNWEKAIEQLEQAVVQLPDSFEAHFLLARSYAERQRYQEAAVHFQQARELDLARIEEVDRQQQHYWTRLYNEAVSKINDQDLEAAIEGLTLAAEIWPEDPRAYRLVGYAYSRLEGTEAEREANREEAIGLLHRAASLDSSHVATWLDLGLNLRLADRTEEALDAYHEALAHDASEVEKTRAYSQLGEIHFEKQDWGSALVMYNKAVEVAPDDAELWYLLGLTQFNQRDYEGAVTSFENAADYSEGHDPEIFEDATHKFGWAALNAEQYDRALEAAEILVVLDPGKSEYYSLRGKVKTKIAQDLRDQGRTDEAERYQQESVNDFQRALELSGEAP